MTLEIHPLTGIPEITEGSPLAEMLVEAMTRAGLTPVKGDVLVVTHKIVSKAEGAVRKLEGDEESGYRTLVLEEAEAIVRRRGPMLIAKTRHGFICANAGVDRSNAAPGTAVLLPTDPDRSANAIRKQIKRLTGSEIAVVVSDTFGRPWRKGLVDVAIGVAGMDAILDLAGTNDAMGRELKVTAIAIVDEIAAAADLVMGKADQIPAALLRGLDIPAGTGRATDLVRSPENELFR